VVFYKISTSKNNDYLIKKKILYCQALKSVFYCKTERQAKYVLSEVQKRLTKCQLSVHPEKAKKVNLRDTSQHKYPRSLNFLGFTLRPYWGKTSSTLEIGTSIM